LQPGPNVVRCARQVVSRSSDGLRVFVVAPGTLAIADSWVVRKWPGHFAPSVT
jgi:hypothetical protein